MLFDLLREISEEQSPEDILDYLLPEDREGVYPGETFKSWEEIQYFSLKLTGVISGELKEDVLSPHLDDTDFAVKLLLDLFQVSMAYLEEDPKNSPRLQNIRPILKLSVENSWIPRK